MNIMVGPTTIDFTVRRKRIQLGLDSSKVGLLIDLDRKIYFIKMWWHHIIILLFSLSIGFKACLCN